MQTITAENVRRKLSAANRPFLLHVLPAEHFSACRIEGAANVCTYETAFVDHVRELVSDPAAEIIVYGEGVPSLDSEDAASKLLAAGYANVWNFRGGLREWRAAGLPVSGTSQLPAAPALDGTFTVDTVGSVIRWTGRNLLNFHEGTLKLLGGSLVVRDGALVRGSFSIDMNSIACADLGDTAMNAMLVRHLKHSDFFAVDLHPTADFEISEASLLGDSSPGRPNYEVAGSLTLRGVTRHLRFPAVIASGDQDHVTAQAVVDLDRTDFGSRYGSGKFFAFLGQHVVNDIVHLHLKICAIRS